MKPEDKDTSKGSSFWGIFCSIALHVVVLILVLFWGFRSTMQDSSPGPIEVSLSELGTGGGGGVRSRPAPPPPPPAPAEPEPEPEPPAPPKEEVAKVPPPEPEKKPEPKKEEPKEVAKVEPDKKVIPIEPEKKPEKTPEPKPEKKEVKKETPAPKKEPEKKPEPKKEVAKKPEPTEKPKAPEKKTTAKSEKNLESEKSKVLQDLKRQKVLDNLKREPSEEPTEMEEPMGEEQRLAMADTEGIPDKPAGEPGELSRSGSGGGGREGGGGGGGSAVNPVLLDIYKKKVHQRIRRNWRIPPGVPTDGNLATLVFFKVDGAGRVFDVRVSKSSGNSAFDQFSIDAIQKSAPLPVPPSEFAAQAEREGMEITFYNRPY